MKAFLCVLGLLAVISSGLCRFSTNSDESDVATNNYVQYLRERRKIEQLRANFETICPEQSDELDDAIIEMKQCSEEINENNETTCSILKNHFTRCSKPMVQLLERCLPKESKDVPKTVFEALQSAAMYLCKTDGEHIFELANHCFFKTNYRTMRCERRVKTKLQQYKNKFPTKTEICELAQSLKPCLHNHLQDSCGHSITRESFMGMFDAIVAPCKLSTGNNQLDGNAINEVELLA